MKIAKHIFKTLLIVSAFLFAISGCGSGDSDAPSAASDLTGTLSLSLVDAPGGNYQAVYVTLQEVQVCIRNPECDGTGESEECECEWETIATLDETYNLMELVGGVMSGLGQKNLEPGDYNQMRLLLGDDPDSSLNMLEEPHLYPQYLVDEEGVVHEMKVPSGYESGIKLVHPFEIVEGLTTELILDFDVSQSVVKAGDSGKYRLKPTIKVIGTHDRAIVSGVVSTDDETPVAGAAVTAWYEDADAGWTAAMSTLTDTDGAYMLYLDLGGENELEARYYNIVASADGYEPNCTGDTVAVDETYPNTDFALAATDMVTVEGTITGTVDSGLTEAPVVSIRFNRTDGSCLFTPTVQATVEGDNTADNSYDSTDGSFLFTYSIDLPEGSYGVTASCDGLTPATETVDLDAAVGPVTLDFDFDS